MKAEERKYYFAINGSGKMAGEVGVGRSAAKETGNGLWKVWDAGAVGEQ